MRAFVITIEDLPASVAAADRCIISFSRTNPAIQVEKWKATTPKDNIGRIFDHKGIDPRYFNEQGGSYTKNCMSAFMSHFRLWEHSVIMNEEIIILEHDAVAVGHIPLDMRYRGCVNLGKPSYGKWEQPKRLGLNPLTSKQYFPGAHAYMIQPAAAEEFIHSATEGSIAGPTDVFIRNDHFTFLYEYYPWPVEARDNFTTIQRDVGCRAKHNWSNEYAILQVR